MFNRNPDILIPLITELEGYIPEKDRRNEAVSSSDVAWQIDHSLKVFNLVSETLLGSEPKAYSSKLNKWRMLFFTLGYFPRGRVRAPKRVRPPEVILEDDLRSQIDIAYGYVEKIKLANRHSHFKHFIFGVLNKKQTIKFLKLHTTHHLRIIRDILK